jgi:hypothetical protein
LPAAENIAALTGQSYVRFRLFSAAALLLVLGGWYAGLCRAYAKNRSNLAMLLAVGAIGFQAWLYW